MRLIALLVLNGFFCRAAFSQPQGAEQDVILDIRDSQQDSIELTQLNSRMHQAQEAILKFQRYVVSIPEIQMAATRAPFLRDFQRIQRLFLNETEGPLDENLVRSLAEIGSLLSQSNPNPSPGYMKEFLRKSCDVLLQNLPLNLNSISSVDHAVQTSKEMSHSSIDSVTVQSDPAVEPAGPNAFRSLSFGSEIMHWGVSNCFRTKELICIACTSQDLSSFLKPIIESRTIWLSGGIDPQGSIPFLALLSEDRILSSGKELMNDKECRIKVKREVETILKQSRLELGPFTLVEKKRDISELYHLCSTGFNPDGSVSRPLSKPDGASLSALPKRPVSIYPVLLTGLTVASIIGFLATEMTAKQAITVSVCYFMVVLFLAYCKGENPGWVLFAGREQIVYPLMFDQLTVYHTPEVKSLFEPEASPNPVQDEQP